ncbi:MAG TPA: hypothetical protein VMZ06_13750 [Candidatus Bathyarchaeia archaeon]|nr:hypothetical protein [Candidatus Bathyarchaeia archaeon]
MKRYMAILSLLAVVVLAGCEKAEPVPVKPPEQEKTPEQIVDLIKKDLAPLATVAGGGMLMEKDKQEIIAKLRTHKAAYQAKENGIIALERITSEIEGVIKVVRDAERWRMVLSCLEIYDVLQPGSAKYQRLKNMAELQRRKPRVKLKGFFRDVASNDQLYAFVQITDPVEGKVYQEQMREGEEKYGIRFNRIIGNQQGVEFEYLAIPGDYFQVMKQSR